MVSKIEFAQKIKNKYPQYANLDDNDLADRMLAKYPQYKTQITDTPKDTPKNSSVTVDAKTGQMSVNGTPISKNEFAGLSQEVQQELLKRSKKDIKKQSIKKGVNAGITAGEIAGGIMAPGASPYIVGAGEFARGKLEGKDNIESLKRGGIGAAVDVATLGVGKTLGKFGKGILKKSISPQFSEPITEKVMKDISLTAPTKKGFEEIGEKTIKSVKQLDRVFGKLVGRSKRMATKAGETLNTTPVKKEAVKLIRDTKLGGLRKLGSVKGVDSKNMNILKKVMKQIDKKNMSIEDAFTSKTNMDEALATVYRKQATPGASLSTAEKAALQIRGKFSSALDNSVDKSVSASKQPFIKLRKLLGENKGELGKKLKSKDDIFATLKTAMTEKDVPMFRRLQEIDDLLPKKKKFLDDTVQKYVREAMTPTRIFPRRFEDIADMLALGTTKMMRGGKKIAPATRAISILGASQAAQGGN